MDRSHSADFISPQVQPGFAYGEAFGGGAGAGPGWHGAHTVSVHSTNTKLTDVEVIESRTPLLLKEFGIRRDSGGSGEWRGGLSSLPRLHASTDLDVITQVMDATGTL